jgi:hypothetical protein
MKQQPFSIEERRGMSHMGVPHKLGPAFEAFTRLRRWDAIHGSPMFAPKVIWTNDYSVGNIEITKL